MPARCARVASRRAIVRPPQRPNIGLDDAHPGLDEALEIGFRLLGLAGGDASCRGGGEAAIAVDVVLVQRFLQPQQAEFREQGRRAAQRLLGGPAAPGIHHERHVVAEHAADFAERAVVPCRVGAERAPAELDGGEAGVQALLGEQRGRVRRVGEQHAGIGADARPPGAPQGVAGFAGGLPGDVPERGVQRGNGVHGGAAASVPAPLASNMSRQRASGSPGSWPARITPRPCRNGADIGASTMAFATVAFDTASPCPTRPVWVTKRATTRTSCVPSAFSSTFGARMCRASTDAIFILTMIPSSGRHSSDRSRDARA